MMKKIKNLFSIFLATFFWSLKSFAATQASDLLITAFEPFAGRAINQSALVAQELQAILPESSLCILPVAYDEASDVAMRCFARAQPGPLRVLSLGEGDCQLKLETKARNLDATPGFADNRGQVRAKSEIIRGGPEFIELSYPMHQLLMNLNSDERSQFMISNDMGGFVCNNTAYRMMNQDLRGAWYGFIHVPNSSCRNSASARETARLIARFLGF